MGRGRVAHVSIWGMSIVRGRLSLVVDHVVQFDHVPFDDDAHSHHPALIGHPKSRCTLSRRRRPTFQNECSGTTYLVQGFLYKRLVNDPPISTFAQIWGHATDVG